MTQSIRYFLLALPLTLVLTSTPLIYGWTIRATNNLSESVKVKVGTTHGPSFKLEHGKAIAPGQTGSAEIYGWCVQPNNITVYASTDDQFKTPVLTPSQDSKYGGFICATKDFTLKPDGLYFKAYRSSGSTFGKQITSIPWAQSTIQPAI